MVTSISFCRVKGVPAIVTPKEVCCDALRVGPVSVSSGVVLAPRVLVNVLVVVPVNKLVARLLTRVPGPAGGLVKPLLDT